MTRNCKGCTRSLTIPEVWMDTPPAFADQFGMDTWVCGKCGSVNKFPLMIVAPYEGEEVKP